MTRKMSAQKRHSPTPSDDVGAPPTTRKRGSRTKWILFGVAFLAVTALAATGFARDRDGSKIQAKSLELSKFHLDTLSPPDDQADWYYIKVESRSELEILISTPQFINIEIHDSSNSKRWSQQRLSGETSTTLEVDPGIYFVVVSTTDGLTTPLISYKIKATLKKSKVKRKK